MSSDKYVFSKEGASAYGFPTGFRNEFIVKEESTAVREGGRVARRDKDLRSELIRNGTLVQDSRSDLLRFVADVVFSSPSEAAGVVQNGNCSGPQYWLRVGDSIYLKEIRSFP